MGRCYNCSESQVFVAEERGWRKMRENLAPMQTLLPEILPSLGSMHRLYPNLLKQRVVPSVICGQSSRSMGHHLKYERDGYLKNIKNVSRPKKWDTLQWNLHLSTFPFFPCIGDRRLAISKAQWDSYSDSEIDAFVHRKGNMKSDNLLYNILECLRGCMGSLNNKFSVDDLGWELMVLAVPAIVGQAIEPMAQLMETAYVGRLGPVELAAVGVSVSVFNLISKLFNIPLLNVTTSYVAEDASRSVQEKTFVTQVSSDGKQNSSRMSTCDSSRGDTETHLTAKNDRKQLPAVSTALILSAGLGVLEAAALAFGAGFLLNIMGIPAASPMRLPSEQYLALRAIGAPALVVSFAVQGIFRGLKDTKTPLYATGAGSILNAVLFPLCMFTLGFGVRGAAIATVVSQYFIAFMLLRNLNRQVVLLPPKLEDLRFDHYLKSGGLLLGRTLAVLVTMTLGTSMAARQGPIFMAGHQICLQVWLAASLLTDALALAGQTLIATAFTKKDYKRVKKVAFGVLQIGLVSGIALAGIVYSGALFFAKLFTKSEDVLEVIRYGVVFAAGSQPINALAFVFDGLHYGVSDFAYAAYSMMIIGALSSLFLVLAPSSLGLTGVWTSLVLFMGLRMAAGFWRMGAKNGPWWFLRQEFQETEICI